MFPAFIRVPTGVRLATPFRLAKLASGAARQDLYRCANQLSPIISIRSSPFLPSSSPLSTLLMAEKTANTMKAIQYDSYGGGAEALKLVDVPVPSPKKNEILLKLKAASLNPIDWKIQKGMLRPFLPPKFPFTPVADVCGEVVEAGSGVSSFKKGDEVVGMLHFPNGGGLAEYAASPVRLMVTKPPGLSPAEAAGLPTAAMTALQALRATGTKFDTTNKPSNVLITAASGGVGHYAIQLAKHAGLHVTATCGARNIELMKSLGADEVLDYKTPEGATLRSPSGRKYDAVIHCTTNISWSTFEPNLCSNGKVIDITPTFKAMVTSVLKTMTLSKKKLVPLVLSPKIEDLKFLVDLAKEGKVKTVVDSIHPLSKAEEAWAKSMSGHATGKIIVEM